MATRENCHFFPLTSLQIGDLQSYLSRLTIFLAFESNKFFILVDNRPWLLDQETRPAHLWQLMVTKSRLSPFANTRQKPESKDIGKRPDLSNSSRCNPIMPKRLYRWSTLIDAALYQKKALLPVKKLRDSFLLNKGLHHTLYGFIVFEVAWAHVQGINYLNELQTDTSMALEAKLMRRWEFDSIEQASSCISSWYSGTHYERFLLQEYLSSVSVKGEVFYDSPEDIPVIDPVGSSECTSNNFEFLDHKLLYGTSSNSIFCPGGMNCRMSLPCTPPPASVSYKRRKIIRSSSVDSEVTEFSEEAYSEIVSSPRLSVSSFSTHSDESENEAVLEATNYRDVLILYRFNDHNLPFELKEIIMSDLRLLTLLEYGLPSWVIFLQSYPLFCQIYRPWMCPLARALYVLISVVTVLIGFYDLYKNVPVLKATVSHLFGPFFDCIETWEMISRIKYLGTMLFLHNFEKAVKWLLTITHAIRSLFTFLTRPIAGPLVELVEFILPLWKICLETIERLSSMFYVVLGSSCNILVSILQIILRPFWFIFSTVWNIATSIICPLFWVLLEILTTPIRLLLALASFIAILVSYLYCFLRETWAFLVVMLQCASASEATTGAYEVSMWRTLWNDLFSQVFRAVRSILYGFVAFFATCNRHRLRSFFYAYHMLHGFQGMHSSHGCQQHGAQNPLEGSGKSSVKHPPLSQKKVQTMRSRKCKVGEINK